MQHSPGLPDDGGLPWVDIATRHKNPEGVPQRYEAICTTLSG